MECSKDIKYLTANYILLEPSIAVLEVSEKSRAKAEERERGKVWQWESVKVS